MNKGQKRFEHLTRGQMRDISHSTLTTRQLAIRYGVPERTIRGVRIAIGRNRKAWHAVRAA